MSDEKNTKSLEFYTEQLFQLRRREIASRVEIGRLLIKAEQDLSQQEYKDFLAEVGWTPDDTTVRNYRNASVHFGHLGADVLDRFHAGAMYMLAGSMVPDNVRLEAIKKATRCQVITKEVAEQLLGKAEAPSDADAPRTVEEPEEEPQVIRMPKADSHEETVAQTMKRSQAKNSRHTAQKAKKKSQAKRQSAQGECDSSDSEGDEEVAGDPAEELSQAEALVKNLGFAVEKVLNCWEEFGPEQHEEIEQIHLQLGDRIAAEKAE